MAKLTAVVATAASKLQLVATDEEINAIAAPVSISPLLRTRA
jgi:hypothetical protein